LKNHHQTYFLKLLLLDILKDNCILRNQLLYQERGNSGELKDSFLGSSSTGATDDLMLQSKFHGAF